MEPASAGTHPASGVNPTVMDVMRELGIDLSTRTPRLLTRSLLDEADLVIAVGCRVREVYPAPMVRHSIDWKLYDPSRNSMEKVRTTRDEVEWKVRELVDTLRAESGSEENKSG